MPRFTPDDGDCALAMEGPHFRVVRFRGVGVREHHELALCIPRDGTRCSVVYPDREIECALQYLVNAEVVNVSSMSSKAYVMCTVDRDRASIRARVEGYDDVSRPCRSLT